METITIDQFITDYGDALIGKTDEESNDNFMRKIQELGAKGVSVEGVDELIKTFGQLESSRLDNEERDTFSDQYEMALEDADSGNVGLGIGLGVAAASPFGINALMKKLPPTKNKAKRTVSTIRDLVSQGSVTDVDDLTRSTENMIDLIAGLNDAEFEQIQKDGYKGLYDIVKSKLKIAGSAKESVIAKYSNNLIPAEEVMQPLLDLMSSPDLQGDLNEYKRMVEDVKHNFKEIDGKYYITVKDADSLKVRIAAKANYAKTVGASAKDVIKGQGYKTLAGGLQKGIETATNGEIIQPNEDYGKLVEFKKPTGVQTNKTLGNDPYTIAGAVGEKFKKMPVDMPFIRENQIPGLSSTAKQESQFKKIVETIRKYPERIKSFLPSTVVKVAEEGGSLLAKGGKIAGKITGPLGLLFAADEILGGTPGVEAGGSDREKTMEEKLTPKYGESTISPGPEGMVNPEAQIFKGSQLAKQGPNAKPMTQYAVPGIGTAMGAIDLLSEGLSKGEELIRKKINKSKQPKKKEKKEKEQMQSKTKIPTNFGTSFGGY